MEVLLCQRLGVQPIIAMLIPLVPVGLNDGKTVDASPSSLGHFSTQPDGLLAFPFVCRRLRRMSVIETNASHISFNGSMRSTTVNVASVLV